MQRLPVTVVVGAGLSASAGLPSWASLLRRVCAVFLYHCQAYMGDSATAERLPRRISILLLDDLFSTREVRAAAEELAQGDAALVAQQVKSAPPEADWRYLVRKVAYNFDSFGRHGVKKPGLVEAVARLAGRSPGVVAVISYNWDNVLEEEAREQGVEVSPIWSSEQRRTGDSLPIYYPHGYLPLQGGPVTKIVLAESDYQQQGTEIYSWANLLQVRAFSNSVCVFVGTSMTDSNIRRLLRISAVGQPPWHYAFLPSRHHLGQTPAMRELLFDWDLVQLGVKAIRYPVDDSLADPYARLPQLIGLIQQHVRDKDAIWSER